MELESVFMCGPGGCRGLVATEGAAEDPPEKKKPTISQRWVSQIWLLDLGSNQGPTD